MSQNFCFWGWPISCMESDSNLFHLFNPWEAYLYDFYWANKKSTLQWIC